MQRQTNRPFEFLSKRPLATGLLAATFLITPSTLIAETVFKWTDESGVIHYGDKKPEHQKVTTIKVSGGKPSAKQAPTAQDENSAAAANDAKAKSDAEEKKRIAESCKKATNQAKTLSTYSRIRVSENGKLRYLSEEEKKQRIQEMQDYVSKNCQ